jgi:hypothetical protein
MGRLKTPAGTFLSPRGRYRTAATSDWPLGSDGTYVKSDIASAL